MRGHADDADKAGRQPHSHQRRLPCLRRQALPPSHVCSVLPLDQNYVLHFRLGLVPCVSVLQRCHLQPSRHCSEPFVATKRSLCEHLHLQEPGGERLPQPDGGGSGDGGVQPAAHAPGSRRPAGRRRRRRGRRRQHAALLRRRPRRLRVRPALVEGAIRDLQLTGGANAGQPRAAALLDSLCDTLRDLLHAKFRLELVTSCHFNTWQRDAPLPDASQVLHGCCFER